jgi:hypothetical protein
MKPEEPPRGGRMLERTEGEPDARERRPAPSESAVANTQDTTGTKPRRTPRKRRKPFVL